MKKRATHSNDKDRYIRMVTKPRIGRIQTLRHNIRILIIRMNVPNFRKRGIPIIVIVRGRHPAHYHHPGTMIMSRMCAVYSSKRCRIFRWRPHRPSPRFSRCEPPPGRRSAVPTTRQPQHERRREQQQRQHPWVVSRWQYREANNNTRRIRRRMCCLRRPSPRPRRRPRNNNNKFPPRRNCRRPWH